MTRFPAWVYRNGSEPDPRFSLANERTFLAWIRTALALLAGGVGLEALHVPEQFGIRFAAAGTLMLLGLVAAIEAWVGWARTERSLRIHRALPGPSTGVIISVGVLAVAIIVAIGALR